MPARQSHHYVFTYNNPADVTAEELYAALGPRYLVCQKERGDTGTLHFQGYVEFAARRTISGLVRSLPGVHWAPRLGTRDQARDYARKADTRVDGPWEFGTWITGPGARTDLLALRDAIKEGSKDAELWENHFGVMLRSHRAVREYRSAISPVRPDVPVDVTVLYGPTGTGKSRLVREVCDDAYWVSNPSAGQPVWFDGYVGQSTLVLDDFYGWMPHSFLLRLLDRYPFQLPCKGYMVPLAATRVFITSNVGPDHWYSSAHAYAPLRRRLTWIFSVMDSIY